MIFTTHRKSLLHFLSIALIYMSLALPTAVNAAEFTVSSAQDIADAMQLANPGDTLIMTNGTWQDQVIDFAGQGAASNAITLRAQTPGGVQLTGNSRLSISGSHLVVDGLNFENGNIDDSESIIQFRGSLGDATNSRLTNTQIKNYNPANASDRAFWVSLYGQGNRVDHSRFQEQTNSGVTVVAWLDGQPANHRIDSNYFADRQQGTENGFETIRIGTSSQSSTNANVVVENNLFERVDGEIEIISNKSNDNTYRFNTIRESAGTLTLRHGNRGTVEGNFILGENKERSGGIRIIGEDHTVINNYIADVDDRADGAISISAGVENSPNVGHQQVKNALIANNTVVNVQGAAITFDQGLGTLDRTLLAEDVTIVNNLFYSTNDPLFEGDEGSGWTWNNNIAFGAELGINSRAGILEVDPQLELAADGLWRPTASSPAIDGGASVSAVTTDFDGQARIGIADIGADEFSTAQIVRKPLTADTVGPEWGRPLSPGASPFVALQAENFSNVLDPDGDGNVWTLVADESALNGAAIAAPQGDRVDLDSEPHDTLALYDLVFAQAGEYTVYYRARGFDGSSDSIFTPSDFDVDPDITETLVNDGLFAWETGTQFTISETHVGMPLEFRLGHREAFAQLDAIVFHTDANLSASQLDALFNDVPEPGAGAALISLLLLRFNRHATNERICV
ncbi:MAG: polysaccharide lyase 6 family protein [Planctomycetota bacterium]